MPERDIPGLWLLPESLEKLRWTLEAKKAHWRNGLLSCLIIWFMAVFSLKEQWLLS